MPDRDPLQPGWPAGQTKSYLTGTLLALSLISYVSFRKLILAYGFPEFPSTAILLAIFTLLFFTQPILTNRFPRYRSVYFLIQMVVVQGLGLLHPYEDTWGLLYILLVMQFPTLPSPRAAGAWAAAFAVALLVSMIATNGLLAGLGFTLLIIALSVFFFSGNLLYLQAEAAKLESQKLLDELQSAHQRLKAYAAQADEQSAAEERDRLVRELHDSVSQMIFSISLTTEATRLLLAKDPGRVPESLASLQELTSRALAQMRTLISQWRPS